MTRIAPVSLAQADAATQTTLNGVKAKLGMVPNLFATFAQAPAALNGYMAFSDALSKGRLSAAQRELIALAVGQTNACQYCLSAHTLIGKGAGLSEAAIRAARSGTAEGVQDKALVELAIKIVRQRGVLADSDLAAAAAAGVDQLHKPHCRHRRRLPSGASRPVKTSLAFKRETTTATLWWPLSLLVVLLPLQAPGMQHPYT